jgi:hypothetical protein
MSAISCGFNCASCTEEAAAASLMHAAQKRSTAHTHKRTVVDFIGMVAPLLLRRFDVACRDIRLPSSREGGYETTRTRTPQQLVLSLAFASSPTH